MTPSASSILSRGIAPPLSSARSVYTLAGNLGNLQNGFLDGSGTAWLFTHLLGETSLFNFPYGIDVLDENNILVSDSDNHALRLITVTGREEPAKPPKPARQLKPAKSTAEEPSPKLPAGPVVASSAMEMLQNSAREAAKKVHVSIIEILLTYTANPAKQSLCSVLGLVHLLLFGEKKKYETLEDLQVLLKRPSLRDEMLSVRPENVPHQNSVFVIKQLAGLKKNDDCKVCL